MLRIFGVITIITLLLLAACNTSGDQTPNPTTYTLDVQKSGNGSGTVTSNPPGINCGSDCSKSFPEGTSVTLTATPESGSEFVSWSGCASTTNTCTVTMNADKNVSVAFEADQQPTNHTLTVNITGEGNVTATAGGQAVTLAGTGSTRTATVAEGTTVTLTATPTGTFTDATWTGCDTTNDNTCTVTMNANKNVGVAFSATASYFSYNDGWRVNMHPRFMADVNGDGRDDIVGFSSSGVDGSFATSANTFTAPQRWVNSFSYDGGWRVDMHPRFMADVNGDGREDIVAFGPTAVSVSLATGHGFGPAEGWVAGYGYDGGWRVDMHPRFMADVNGDGRDDIVGFGGNGVSVALATTANTFSSPTMWSGAYGYDGGWRVDMHPRFMADVNGDGRDDIVGFSSSGVDVSLATSANTFTAPQRWVNGYGYDDGWRVNMHLRMMADVNGDGKDDFVAFGSTGVFVGQSTGTSFTATPVSYITAP